MGGLSWWHWLVIGGAFILLFGAKKLPDAARGVGRSLRILKSEVTAMHEEGAAAATGAPAAGPAGPAAATALAAPAISPGPAAPPSAATSTTVAAPVVAAPASAVPGRG